MNFRSRELHLQRHQVIPHHKVVVPLEPPIEPPVGKDCGWRFVRLPWNARVDGKPFYSFMSFITSWMKRGGQTINLYVTGWVSSCSVITVPKEVGLHTTAPPNSVLNPVSFPSPVPPVPPPPVFPPVGATYRYGYYEASNKSWNSLDNNDFTIDYLPLFSVYLSTQARGQYVDELNGIASFVAGKSVMVYTLDFVSQPLLVNTWTIPLPYQGNTNRWSFHDPFTQLTYAGYFQDGTFTTFLIATIIPATGAMTFLNAGTLGASSLRAHQTMFNVDVGSEDNSFFVALSFQEFIGVERVCKISKTTMMVLAQYNFPVTVNFRNSVAITGSNQDMAACGEYDVGNNSYGVNFFDSNLTLLNTVQPPASGSFWGVSGNRYGSENIFFTLSDTGSPTYLGLVKRFARVGAAYVETHSVGLPAGYFATNGNLSIAYSATNNVLTVSSSNLGGAAFFYNGSNLTLIETDATAGYGIVMQPPR